MVQDKDRIAVLHANGYVGATKQTISIARNPKRFALVLEPNALRLQKLAFPNDPFYPEDERAKDEKPSDPTVRCKLPRPRKAELVEALREDGYADMQSGLSYIINMYLIRRKHEESVEQAG